MERLSFEKENIIKDITNLFRLEKETRTLKDMKKVLEHEKDEENYHKPVRVSNLWSNIYIEHESNDDRNKTPSVEEYLHKIRPYLNNVINNLKKSDI